MNTKPILFSTDMVRALLDGRKTQTRRVNGFEIINQRPNDFTFKGFVSQDRILHAVFWDHRNDVQVLVKCPFGRPGDLLWVREMWSIYIPEPPSSGCPLGDVWVPEKRSDLPRPSEFGPDDYAISYFADHADSDEICYPSIFMPRWASRLTLRITNVRVERVQDIGEEDAYKEGAPHEPGIGLTEPRLCYRNGFLTLWNSINAKRGFGSKTNPWVWVIDFEVIQQNVDDIFIIGRDTPSSSKVLA